MDRMHKRGYGNRVMVV